MKDLQFVCIRIPREIWKRVRMRSVETGESTQAMVTRVLAAKVGLTPEGGPRESLKATPMVGGGVKNTADNTGLDMTPGSGVGNTAESAGVCRCGHTAATHKDGVGWCNQKECFPGECKKFKIATNV